jgi:hypothetical protein
MLVACWSCIPIRAQPNGLLPMVHFKNPSFTELLPSSRNLILRHIPMLPLPLMSMQRKTLTFRPGYPWKHAHFHNYHGRINLRDAHDGTVTRFLSKTILTCSHLQKQTGGKKTKPETSKLTSHTRHKNTVPHTSHSPSHNPYTSSSHPFHP